MAILATLAALAVTAAPSHGTTPSARAVCSKVATVWQATERVERPGYRLSDFACRPWHQTRFGESTYLVYFFERHGVLERSFAVIVLADTTPVGDILLRGWHSAALE